MRQKLEEIKARHKEALDRIAEIKARIQQRRNEIAKRRVKALEDK